MESHAFSGPAIGVLMVVVGIFIGRGGYTRPFWRRIKSVGFPLRVLVGLCILFGTTWLLQVF